MNKLVKLLLAALLVLGVSQKVFSRTVQGASQDSNEAYDDPEIIEKLSDYWKKLKESEYYERGKKALKKQFGFGKDSKGSDQESGQTFIEGLGESSQAGAGEEQSGEAGQGGLGSDFGRPSKKPKKVREPLPAMTLTLEELLQAAALKARLDQEARERRKGDGSQSGRAPNISISTKKGKRVSIGTGSEGQRTIDIQK